MPLSGNDDEIDELTKTFNRLIEQLEKDFERERQFSSDVSHELKTPLAVILGQTNLLMRWGKDNPEQLEISLNAIKDESKSMHAIIENLLQISRIESGRIKPVVSRVDIKELYNRVADEFASVAPQAGFEIDCNGDCVVESDPEMLHQILTILVSNSVKFSEGKCTVCLQAGTNEEGILLRVSDDGPGIAKKTLPHIFERFYRGDEAHTRSAGGSGLGLSIAKTLCSALGAQITAGNIKPHGAMFEIQVPQI